MSDTFNEKDWKLFRKKVADWQENYIEKLTREYIELLSGEGYSSDKFWELDKRIKRDKKKAGVMITDMSRSNMMFIIMQLLNEKVITLEDLADFSDELKEHLEFLRRR
ncbi:MAG: multidrug transporter [Selenomonas sp.]|nr:multidrug transporter [Selenomonas sp.]